MGGAARANWTDGDAASTAAYSTLAAVGGWVGGEALVSCASVLGTADSDHRCGSVQALAGPWGQHPDSACLCTYIMGQCSHLRTMSAC